jgi:transposase-like protein
MDGKSFAENEAIIALGVTMEGWKVILGMVESNTENHRVCKEFLQGLKGRGLSDDNKLLFIIDGSKGLRKGIRQVFGKQALIQRCQWHKRENVVAYLPKSQQGKFRKKLQKTHQQDGYEAAKKMLMSIRKELNLLNQSAVNSLAARRTRSPSWQRWRRVMRSLFGCNSAVSGASASPKSPATFERVSPGAARSSPTDWAVSPAWLTQAAGTLP